MSESKDTHRDDHREESEGQNDMVLHALHLCSGYGGFELALRETGMEFRTVAHVERDSYAAAVLVARMEQARLDQAPIWSDLTTFDTGPWAGRVDIVTAGFPCQPFSSAGQQKGVDDDRWLWPSIGRIIGELGPRFVFLENVPGLVRAGLPHVLADLADLGFNAEWGVLPASSVGASHERSRCWLLGYADGGRREAVAELAGGTQSRFRRDTHGSGESVGRRSFPPARYDRTGWAEWLAEGGPEPSVRRGPDGRPPGLADALHLGGNGLVPQCATEAFLQLYDRLLK